jgi:hypothetical protein
VFGDAWLLRKLFAAGVAVPPIGELRSLVAGTAYLGTPAQALNKNPLSIAAECQPWLRDAPVGQRFVGIIVCAFDAPSARGKTKAQKRAASSSIGKLFLLPSSDVAHVVSAADGAVDLQQHTISFDDGWFVLAKKCYSFIHVPAKLRMPVYNVHHTVATDVLNDALDVARLQCLGCSVKKVDTIEFELVTNSGSLNTASAREYVRKNPSVPANFNRSIPLVAHKWFDDGRNVSIQFRDSWQNEYEKAFKAVSLTLTNIN